MAAGGGAGGPEGPRVANAAAERLGVVKPPVLGRSWAGACRCLHHGPRRRPFLFHPRRRQAIAVPPECKQRLQFPGRMDRNRWPRPRPTGREHCLGGLPTEARTRAAVSFVQGTQVHTADWAATASGNGNAKDLLSPADEHKPPPDGCRRQSLDRSPCSHVRRGVFRCRFPGSSPCPGMHCSRVWATECAHWRLLS